MTVRRALLTLSLATALAACSEDPPPAKPEKAVTSATAPAAAPKKESRKAAAAKDEADTNEPPPPSGPIDFAEASRWRDPFMSYAKEFATETKKRVKSQREVLLDQYALDDLKLAGLI